MALQGHKVINEKAEFALCDSAFSIKAVYEKEVNIIATVQPCNL